MIQEFDFDIFLLQYWYLPIFACVYCWTLYKIKHYYDTKFLTLQKMLEAKINRIEEDHEVDDEFLDSQIQSNANAIYRNFTNSQKQFAKVESTLLSLTKKQENIRNTQINMEILIAEQQNKYTELMKSNVKNIELYINLHKLQKMFNNYFIKQIDELHAKVE